MKKLLICILTIIVISTRLICDISFARSPKGRYTKAEIERLTKDQRVSYSFDLCVPVDSSFFNLLDSATRLTTHAKFYYVMFYKVLDTANISVQLLPDRQVINIDLEHDSIVAKLHWSEYLHFIQSEYKSEEHRLVIYNNKKFLLCLRNPMPLARSLDQKVTITGMEEATIPFAWSRLNWPWFYVYDKAKGWKYIHEIKKKNPNDRIMQPYMLYNERFKYEADSL